MSRARNLRTRDTCTLGAAAEERKRKKGGKREHQQQPPPASAAHARTVEEESGCVRGLSAGRHCCSAFAQNITGTGQGCPSWPQPRRQQDGGGNEPQKRLSGYQRLSGIAADGGLEANSQRRSRAAAATHGEERTRNGRQAGHTRAEGPRRMADTDEVRLRFGCFEFVTSWFRMLHWGQWW